MSTTMIRLSLLFVTVYCAPSQLIGLFHAAGDASSCNLISIDATTGANTTLASVSVCSGLTENFPAYSSADQSTGTLFVAITSAATVFGIDVKTGVSTPMGRLANNDSDTLVGAAFVAGAGFLIVTPSGLWNVTEVGPSQLLKAFTTPLNPSVVTSANDGGTGGAGRIFIADSTSNVIQIVDLGDLNAQPKEIKGITKPSDFAHDNGFLYQEAGYVLSSVSVNGGGAKKVINLPNGPGFPSSNGIFTPGTWFFQDFNNTFLVDIKAKLVTKLDEAFLGAPRRVGFPWSFE